MSLVEKDDDVTPSEVEDTQKENTPQENEEELS